MKKKLSLPFQNMTPRGWQNLAIVATITFYLIFMGSIYINLGICKNSTMDFCAYWVSGKIVNQRGFADIYDLNIQQQFQREYFEFSNIPTAQTFAIMYPPIFVVPFQLLSFLSPTLGYLIWTFINLIGFILYLSFFIKKTGTSTSASRYILLFIISLPVFVNFYEGQVNVWLGICAGEFIRAILEDKPFKAGLWLGGWLIKPQILLLIIPFIFIQRSKKIFPGFLTSASIVFITSFALIGIKGFQTLINVLQTSALGGGVSNPLGMMNWRMVGTRISLYTSPTFGLIITIVGSVLTVGLTIYFFREKIKQNSEDMVIAILAIFAATNLITWHAHFHMLIILIPPMLFLLIKDQFNMKFFLLWVFLPILVEFLDRNMLVLIYLNVPLPILATIIKILEGLRGFILNLSILIWAIVTYVKKNKPPIEEKALA